MVFVRCEVAVGFLSVVFVIFILVLSFALDVKHRGKSSDNIAVSLLGLSAVLVVVFFILCVPLFFLLWMRSSCPIRFLNKLLRPFLCVVNRPFPPFPVAVEAASVVVLSLTCLVLIENSTDDLNALVEGL